MKRFNLLFSLLMAASFVSGQTTLQGIVVDASSHRPISFVSVSVKGSHSGFFDGSTTDANGRYSVANLPADTFVVTLTTTSSIRRQSSATPTRALSISTSSLRLRLPPWAKYRSKRPNRRCVSSSTRRFSM